MAYLRCPECRLTVPASAYYLRGDECPRCLTAMRPYHRPRVARAAAPSSVVLDEPAIAPDPALAPPPAVLEDSGGTATMEA